MNEEGLFWAGICDELNPVLFEFTRGIPTPKMTDTLGNFGSYTLSMAGATVVAGAGAVTAASADGFYNATVANDVPAAGLVYKVGNQGFPITFTVGNSTPFVLGTVFTFSA